VFTESITYPTKGDDALSTLVIGSLLTVFGFLIVPLIFVLGYIVRVARSVSNAESAPPDFGDWRSLFVDGLKLLGILLAYAAVPFALVVVGWAAVWTVRGVPDVGLDPLLVRRILIALGITGSALVLVSGYAAPAGIVNFARTGRASGAFAFRTLWPVLKSRSYGVAWISALGVMIAANVIVGILAATIVGSLFGSVVYFYAALTSIYLYVRGFRRGDPVEPIRNGDDGGPTG
jgi:hypothetical protein